jgi:hypothetical protein
MYDCGLPHQHPISPRLGSNFRQASYPCFEARFPLRLWAPHWVRSPSVFKLPFPVPGHPSSMEPASPHFLRIQRLNRDTQKWPPPLSYHQKRASLTVIRTSPSHISHNISSQHLGVRVLITRVIATSPARPRPQNHVPNPSPRGRPRECLVLNMAIVEVSHSSKGVKCRLLK